MSTNGQLRFSRPTRSTVFQSSTEARHHLSNPPVASLTVPSMSTSLLPHLCCSPWARMCAGNLIIPVWRLVRPDLPPFEYTQLRCWLYVDCACDPSAVGARVARLWLVGQKSTSPAREGSLRTKQDGTLRKLYHLLPRRRFLLLTVPRNISSRPG